MAFVCAAVSCKKLMDDGNQTELDTRKCPKLTRTSRLPLLGSENPRIGPAQHKENSESRFSCAGH